MNLPDWNRCDENELWRYVAWHLAGEGISTVLVGGAVVAIYSNGSYRSGDLDIIISEPSRPLLAAALAKIGFSPGKSRYYRHPECSHLVLEFPKGPWNWENNSMWSLPKLRSTVASSNFFPPRTASKIDWPRIFTGSQMMPSTKPF